jgi:hypothetical protein
LIFVLVGVFNNADGTKTYTRDMAIYRLIANGSFEPEQIEVMTAAYEAALLDLGLADRDDPLTEIVARAIVTITDLGERDHDKIKERALRVIGVPRTIGDAA